MTIAVSAHGLSKSYRIPSAFRAPAVAAERVSPIFDFAARAVARARRFSETVWVLDDATFDIAEGEIVGVIGRNGSGKSTLLKVLSRIVRPTRGTATVRGRVGALLEVGTGFHPDLTGNENIYLNGTLLGMKPHEIKAKFDEIVAFAEVERYLETPVKYYSSGMYTRLAFAVAAHLDPEVLIVDEVLSVGDLAFQKKCLGKMGDMTRAGRTVFFVSHNMAAVSELCTRCLLLRQGKIVCDDKPEIAIQRYVEGGEILAGGSFTLPRPPGDAPIYMSRATLTDTAGDPVTTIEMGKAARIEIDYVVETPMRGASIEMLLSRNGVPVLSSFDTDADDASFEQRQPGHYSGTVTLPLEHFKEGHYTAEFPINWGRQTFHDPRAVLNFEIANLHRDLTHRSYRADRPGQYAIDLTWNTKRAT